MNKHVKLPILIILAILFAASASLSHAITFTVTNEAGEPLSEVMISQIPLDAPEANLADGRQPSCLQTVHYDELFNPVDCFDDAGGVPPASGVSR